MKVRLNFKKLFLILTLCMTLWTILAPKDCFAAIAMDGTQKIKKDALKKQVQHAKDSLVKRHTPILAAVEVIDYQLGKMLTDMKHNKQLVSDDSYVSMGLQRVRTLLTYYSQEQHILGRLSKLDEDFYKQFFLESNKNVTWSRTPWIKNYSEQYYKLSRSLETKVNNILDDFNQAVNDYVPSFFSFTTSSTIDLLKNMDKKIKDLEEKYKKEDSVLGRNKLLQISNELATVMSGEMLKMRVLALEQRDAYADFFRQIESEEAAFSSFMEVDVNKWQTSGTKNSYTGIFREDHKSKKQK